jgi:hypothetical protein
MSFTNAGVTTLIVTNVDYFNDVTQGVRASRPSSGLTVGQGYWATDQGGNWDTTNGTANDGCLDRATSSTTWTNCAYTPYTYPHPLVTS